MYKTNNFTFIKPRVLKDSVIYAYEKTKTKGKISMASNLFKVEESPQNELSVILEWYDLSQDVVGISNDYYHSKMTVKD